MLCDSCKRECKHSVHRAEEDTPDSTSSSSRSREGGDPDHNEKKKRKAKRKPSNVTFASPVTEEPLETLPSVESSGDTHQPGESSASFLAKRKSAEEWSTPFLFIGPAPEAPSATDTADSILKSAKSAPALHAPADLHRVVSPGTAPPVIPPSPVVTPERRDDDSSQGSARDKLKNLRERSKSRVGTVGRSFLTVFWKPRRRKQGKTGQ